MKRKDKVLLPIKDLCYGCEKLATSMATGAELCLAQEFDNYSLVFWSYKNGAVFFHLAQKKH